MLIHLYAGQYCWLMLPDFLQPPLETARYEPFTLVGSIDERTLIRMGRGDLLCAIEQRLHVVVGDTDVAFLLSSTGALGGVAAAPGDEA